MRLQWRILCLILCFAFHAFAENQEEASDASEQKEDPTKERYIEHPLAEKGLTRITSEGDYIYEVDSSRQENTWSFKVGPFEPRELENPDSGHRFGDLYDTSSSLMLLVGYEWNLLRGALGRTGFKLGTGFFVATGKGRFEDSGNVAPEAFTFLAFPSTAALTYYMQFLETQWIVPYVEGGIDATPFTEVRDDNQGPKFGGSLGAHGAGGLAFNIGQLSREALLTLDSEYGINSLYFTLEAQQSVHLASKFDFSGTLFTAGFLMEL